VLNKTALPHCPHFATEEKLNRNAENSHWLLNKTADAGRSDRSKHHSDLSPQQQIDSQRNDIEMKLQQ
jgi:hypothetical protein